MRKTLLLSTLCCSLSLCGEGTGLINPDFREDQGGWVLSTMANEVFELRYDADEQFVEINSTGPDYSGYLAQTVPVRPGASYRLNITLRHLKGRGLLWITGYNQNKQPLAFDRRKYLISSEGNPLVPFFVKKEWMQGSSNTGWRTETLDFKAEMTDQKPGEVHYVRISLGVYFSTATLQFRHAQLQEVKQ